MAGGEDAQGRFLDVDGGRLESVWHGPRPEEAPTLVFLHHGIGCVTTWRDFPADLARATGCGALVYSRFGYGASDPCALPRPVRFMHTEGLDVLPQVLAAAGVRDCILVGHSDGGSIALVHTGGTPAASVRGLILEAAHVFCEEETVGTIRSDLETFLAGGELREKLERHHGANTDTAFRGWADTWLQADFMRWNLEEYLPRVKVPALVVQGEDDAYGTLAQVASLERNLAGEVERLVLPDCGHSPHRDQEEAVLEAMTRFVRRLLS